MVAVALVVVGGIYFLLSTAPETIVRNRMLVIPGGWQRFLGAFGLAVGGVATLAYLYGLATRPLRAGRYALTMGTHVFMWVVILLVLYPVVYLFAVSFNENNTLATTMPRDGNVIVRAGVVPDPARVSTVQYTKVLQEFHVEWYQVALFVVLVLAVLGIVAASLGARYRGLSAGQADTIRTRLGFVIVIAAAVLIVSVRPGQFYGISEGRRLPASIGGMVPLYIRNTLLVSGLTGLLAVALATPAGYAFSRLGFEGRYSTLLTFVIVQIFPPFTAP